MKRLALGICMLAVAGVVSPAVAQDKGDPTGTWKWTIMIGDQSRENTLKLKLDGGKLTGVMLGRNDQETAIEEATFKDGEISFTVNRERNGMKIATKYKGKLSGDTIKGKIEGGGGRARGKAKGDDKASAQAARDWEAKRSKS